MPMGLTGQLLEEVVSSVLFVTQCGVKTKLARFSPIPGTVDGDACQQWIDLSEPLMHNKTAFPIIRFGFKSINRLKQLQRSLNRELTREA